MGVTSAAPAEGRLRRASPMSGWTTPRWILTLAAVCVFLAVVLGAFASLVVGTVRDGVTVIGREAAPQVSAATGLYFALSDMDAQIANVLLVGNDPGFTGHRQEALDTYQQRRIEANRALWRMGIDDSSQQAVNEVLDRLGRYESLAGQIIVLNERESNPAGRPSTAVLERHRQATDLMNDTLRIVRGLTTTNHDLLNRTYVGKHAGIEDARLWLWIIGGLLVVALVAVQVFLRVRLRRRLNPAILFATVIVGGVVVVGSAALSREVRDLEVAKANAFDSIAALSQARAVGYDANADESRYLVDPGRAARYEQSFVDKSQSLVALKETRISQFDGAFDDALRAYRNDNTDVRFGGYFGTEMNNITFAGEREAAERALAGYQVYQRDDRRIRQLAASGDLRGAIAFCIATTPGNSNYNFAQYDQALLAVIDINQRAFDPAVGDAETELTGWGDLVPLGVPVVVTVLVGIGLWPRLVEYR
jgi:hypothetical protein